MKANYAGDNSFNSSSASATYSITPGTAPTISTPQACCSGTVGSSFLTNVTIQSQSFGAAPTERSHFWQMVRRSAELYPIKQPQGRVSQPTASLTAYFTSSNSAFPSAGNVTITASYSGDANYASATSSGSSISVKYPAPLLSMSPLNVTVAAGTSVRVGASSTLL